MIFFKVSTSVVLFGAFVVLPAFLHLLFNSSRPSEIDMLAINCGLAIVLTAAFGIAVCAVVSLWRED